MASWHWLDIDFPTNLSSLLDSGFVPYFQPDHPSLVEFWGVQCMWTQALAYEILVN